MTHLSSISKYFSNNANAENKSKFRLLWNIFLTPTFSRTFRRRTLGQTLNTKMQRGIHRSDIPGRRLGKRVSKYLTGFCECDCDFSLWMQGCNHWWEKIYRGVVPVGIILDDQTFLGPFLPVNSQKGVLGRIKMLGQKGPENEEESERKNTSRWCLLLLSWSACRMITSAFNFLLSLSF